ncbi:serine/arginine-rich splicing factor 4 isoform X1 [Bicyclus anynana]|uniref:Serine/arginine-rich splicing factor 4 isoform X1 n=1 Tax=Bicyclus anynana TaxID=110368 RepID=A0A6J1NNK1_BICAN|nr:serine/arginine-rich splicing factor 4 isoform X1 [Bicyclus anynana]
MPREKSRYRDRRSSSYSSESSHERKKSKSKHRRRSRSTDRSESSSHRRRRSSSRSKHRRRSYSRSVSRERYESKSRRRSTSRSRSKRSRHSRARSRSRSHSHSKYSKSSKQHRRRSRSSSRGSRASLFDIEPRKLNLDDTDIKIEKAIKAAEAAGLTMTKIPTYEYKDVEVKEEMPTIHDRNLIAELNSDSFVQKPFISSKSKKQSQNIIIDLNAETVSLPKAEVKVQNDDSIINFEEIPSHEELKEMWIKKLYQFRKKMLKDELQIN